MDDPGRRPEALTPAKVLGRTVRTQRRLLGLTQADLALHAGVGLAFLYQLETGKATARLDKVLAVLSVLGVAVTLELARPDHRPGTLRSTLPESPA
jgi:y4mF family transcriptional regulator